VPKVGCFVKEGRNSMKKVSYILLFDKDLKTSSELTLSIHRERPGSSIYHASSTHNALKMLDIIPDEEAVLNHQREVCFIVDLNMTSLEGYVFLISLEQHDFNCPVRVYVLNDESRLNTNHPSTDQYHIAGRFDKPLQADAMKEILKASSPIYFQKNAGASTPLRFY
jgi:hypothetical protein